MNVTAIIWIKNCDVELRSWWLNRFFTTKVDTITIATLMKLLAINIVASSFLGLDNKFNILFPLVEFSFSRFSFSETDNEKKATSEPDINADEITSVNINTKVSPNSKEKGWKAVKKIFSEVVKGNSKLNVLV